MIGLLLLTALIAIVIYLTAKAHKINQRWAEAGIPHPKPVLIFGNMFDMCVKRRTHDEIAKQIFEDFPNEPVIGYYNFISPRLIIRDLELIERVLIKDFSHFVDRSEPIDRKKYPLEVDLFSLCGNAWRAVRAKLSPMFATGKLRHMLPQVNDIADKFTRFLETNIENVDLKDNTSKFTLEVIASSFFGIEPSALNAEETEFTKMSKRTFQPGFTDFLRITLLFILPKFARMLGLDFSPKASTEYFANILKMTLQHRKASKQTRNDFVQLMVTLQEKGILEVGKSEIDENLNVEELSDDDNIELTDDVMAMQALLFLFAGFETTASALSFIMLELAQNPDLQEIARNEILEIVKEGQDLTYENIKSMTYVDAVIKESLRLHPPVGSNFRMCVKKYPVPGTNIILQPGENVIIPVLAIHTDPDIYPEPSKFLPERWLTDSTRRPCTWLPFGDGPRMCIASRFAMMELKSVMGKLLIKYKFNRHPGQEYPVKINPYSFLATPVKPIRCNLEPLKHL